MFANTKKGLARKLDELESTEVGNGGLTVEYVLIVAVIVGLGVVLFAFQGKIKEFVGTVQNSLSAMLTKLSTGPTA